MAPHDFVAYVGECQHRAKRVLKIGLKDGYLQFDIHEIQLPVTHFRDDCFDTPEDGFWRTETRSLIYRIRANILAGI
jgi:hypothetical protein